MKATELPEEVLSLISTMATKQDLAALVETMEERFEKIESTMATKQDLAALVGTMEERFKDLLIKYLRPGGNGH